ncbi:MAG: hypothetical protein JNN32_03855 [Flavobacteriales bacterium]|nr:hypothetical protein [Flavobacteriales bacterium]
MKTANTRLCAALAVVLPLFAFTPPEAGSLRTGNYGVCGCDGGPQGSSVVLTIDPDGTFRYVNTTDPTEQVDVSGRWTVDGNKVTLRTSAAPQAVFAQWTMDKDDACVRSRQGLLFTRLCHMEACE